MQEIFEFLSRGWTDLIARPRGPYGFRFVLQPLMAALLAVRDGIGDAHTGRSPYFWTVMHDKGQRRERFAEALKATARIGALAILIDAAYQLRVLDTFHADEALAVALLLALAPYLLLRGPVDRIARRWRASRTPKHPAPAGTSAARTNDLKGVLHGTDRQAQHPRHLGRRHRPLEPVLLPPRHAGRPDPQH